MKKEVDALARLDGFDSRSMPTHSDVVVEQSSVSSIRHGLPWPRICIALIITVPFLVLYGDLWGFFLDDAFISLRYAHNLVVGNGLVYNVGERVEGYTNFLWTVLLAIPLALNSEPVLAIKFANLLMTLAAAGALYYLGRQTLLATSITSPPSPVSRVAGDRPARKGRGGRSQTVQPSTSSPSLGPGAPRLELALLPPALFLASPLVAVSAAEGLETMLFCLLLLSSLALFVAEEGRDRLPWSATACVALALTRPEGALLGPGLLILGIGRRYRRSYLLRFALLFFGLFLTYFVLRWSYYGQLLPNTFLRQGERHGRSPASWKLGDCSVRF